MLWIAVASGIGLGIGCILAMRHARRIEQRHRKLLRTSRDLVWMLDAQGCWAYVNEAAFDIYGYAPPEMIGRAFTEFVVPDRADQDRAFVAEAMESAHWIQYETVHQHRDGTRLQMAFRAIANESGAIGTAADIGHMRELEKRLVQTERMHAVGSLAGGVAHDFKNLLTVVVGQAEIAKTKGDAETGRRMDIILDTAERGRGMVEQLLVFAREHSLKREVVDLVEVVRGMEELLRRLLREEMVLKTSLSRTPVRIRADWSKVEQIVMNLVTNAQDATPGDGSIIIQVAEGKLGPRKAAELSIEPGRWAMIQVIDHGEGMSDEVLAHMFEPFYTTKGEGKGTGLGLATVHGLTHQYGGTVTVRSVPGRGTRVSVLLPLMQEEAVGEETTDSIVLPTGV